MIWPNERKTDAQNLKTAAISQWKCSHDNVAHVSKGILSFRTHSRFVSNSVDSHPVRVPMGTGFASVSIYSVYV